MSEQGTAVDSRNTDEQTETTPHRELQRIPADEMDHVTMSVTEDVSDMECRDREVLFELAELYEESFVEVVAKNRDYSWSFLKTGGKIAMTDATPYDTAVRSQVDGLLHRTGDKRERLMEKVFGDGDASVSDPAWKTATEVANYYLFMAFILKNPELASSFGNDS